MKRPLHADELALWRHVTQTVRPFGSHAPDAALPPPMPRTPLAPPPPVAPQPPKPLEPGRLQRIARGRDGLGPRLDLHGFDQDQARAALMRFLPRAQAEGWRAVVVITGRGLLGDGVLRRRAPDWLAEPQLRDVVAGVAEAHRRHGGEGALYVALKRPRGR